MRLTKKICAIVLTLAMLIGCMGVFTVSAATAVQFTGIAAPAPYLNTTGDAWFMYLTMDTNLGYPDWDNGGAYAQSVEINGVATTVSAKYAGATSMFFEIPTASVGTQAEIVFKAGSYTSTGGSSGSYTYELSSDFTLVYEDSAWISYTGVLQPLTLSGVKSASYNANAGRWEIYLAASTDATSSWDYAYSTLTLEINAGGTVTTLNSGNDIKYVGDLYMGIPSTYLPETPATGTIVTVSGRSACANTAWNGIEITTAYSFQWDGSAWATYITYTTYTGTLTTVDALAGSNSTANQVYLKGSDGLAGAFTSADWSDRLTPADDADSGLFLNGTKLPNNGVNQGLLLRHNESNNGWFVDWDSTYAAVAGDILTVKGVFTNEEHATKVVIEESTFQWNGSAWSDYAGDTTVYESMTLTKVKSVANTSPWAWYLSTSTTDHIGNWDYSYNDLTVTINGTAIDRAAFGFKYTDTNGYSVYFELNDAATLSATPATGTTISISGKSKCYTDKTGAAVNDSMNGIELTEAFTMVYDGTTWSIPSAEYAEYTGTLTTEGAEKTDSSTQLYTIGSDGLSGAYADTNWADRLFPMDGDENGVFVDGNKLETSNANYNGRILKYSESNQWFADVTGVTTGTIVTIKGTFYNEDRLTKVTIEESSFQWNGTNWVDYVQVDYAQTSVTGINSQTTKNANGTAWYLYFNLSADMPGTAWETIDNVAVMWSQSVTVGGSELTVQAKKWGTNGLFIELPVANTPAAGETLTLNAGQYQSNVGNYGYELTADFVMTYNGSGFVAGEYNDPVVITPSSFHAASKFDAGLNVWDFYIVSDPGLPGADWAGAWTQNITINGTATTVNVQHGGGGTDTGLMFMRIPASVLSTDGEYTVTLKAGWYGDKNSTNAYQLNEDVNLYVNKYGVSFTDFIAVSTTVKPSLSVNTALAGNGANGFYILASEDDGAEYATDWSLATYANGRSDDGKTIYIGNNGFFLNGTQYVEGGTNRSGMLKKLGATEYYVCLIDIGANASVSTDTVLTIKGLFHDQNGYLVEFEESAFRYNGTDWANYLGDYSGSSVKYDVNNDGNITVKDAVLLEKYLADTDSATLSKTAADIDNSGTIDAEDQRLLRRKLLGIEYVYVDDVPLGTPYYGTSEMVKCAYDAPRIGTVDTDAQVVNFLSDDEIDRLMDDYAAVGFTHIQTEFVAELYYSEYGEDYYYNDLLYRYYEEAEERGLKVFVYSNDIVSWLVSETDVDTLAPNWQAVIDILVEQQSKHSAFDGFMMSDEPVTAGRVGNYLKITKYIKENHPTVNMWWSNNPIAAESTITTNTGMTYAQYVSALGTAAGQFMYDNYVLRMMDSNVSSLFDEYYIEPMWFSNLYTVAEAAKAGGFTTGITMQSVALDPETSTWNEWENRAISSQADIGFQTYTALAYGMKSINWFTYWEHWDPGANIVEGTAMVQSDGTKNAHYDYIKNVHANVEAMERALLNCEWLGTIELDLPAYNDTDDSWSTYTAADNTRLDSVTHSGSAVVGCLQDKDGFDGYVIANAQEPHEGGSSTVTLTFNTADQAIVYGADGSVTTVNLTSGVYSVTLTAGTGVFVIPVYNG